jgi:hypothetical protein
LQIELKIILVQFKKSLRKRITKKEKTNIIPKLKKILEDLYFFEKRFNTFSRLKKIRTSSSLPLFQSSSTRVLTGAESRIVPLEFYVPPEFHHQSFLLPEFSALQSF